MFVRALLIAAFLTLPCGARTIFERFRESYPTWEKQLERGDAISVRRAVEDVIRREGANVNPSDYNEMRALVGALDIAARACVLEGAWEDALLYLQKASSTAADNLAYTENTFSKVRGEHEQKLKEWGEAVALRKQRLKEMDEQTGLTEAQMKIRTQLRTFVEEHQVAIDHSEKALKEIDGLLGQIRGIRVAYEKSLAEWRSFLATEKVEIAQAGSAAQYVTEKLTQVRNDETKPRFDRLAYARRLRRLDPANPACEEFVSSFGAVDAAAPSIKKAAPSKAKPKRQSSKRS